MQPRKGHLLAKGRGDAPASACATSGIAAGIAAGSAASSAAGIAAGIPCACEDSATVGQSPQDLGELRDLEGRDFVVYVGVN